MADSLGYDGGLTCAIQVKDRKASAKWYQDVLGFKLLYDVEEIGWCELATSVERVNVGLSQVESPQVKGGTTLTFGVKDVAAARKQLESKDVRFDGPTRVYEGMVKLATFYDPDGNTLMLFEDLSKQG